MSLVEGQGLGTDVTPRLSTADVGDFFALMKPRVMSLVVFTALVGMVVAPGHLHWVLGLTALLCIAVGAGAAGALNMWYDADIDAKMRRTVKRPIPAGRVMPGEALAYGITLSVFSVTCLGLFVNVAAAALLAFTIFFYAVIYSMLLKRATPQNIVIGGAAGAFPPMIGWAAVTGGLSIEPIILFLIIFFWTPPHFWALALYHTGDYERAGVPMLPVVSGDRETRRQIMLYTVLLVPIGMAPWFFGFGGVFYAIISGLGGAMMLWLAFRVWRQGRGSGSAANVKDNAKPSKQLFGFSILYLFLLFAALLAEHAVAALTG